MRRALALLLALAAMPTAAEEVVLGLSQDQVAITAGFDGSRLLIFGAVRREVPIPADSELDVIMTVTGPPQRVDVFRKERRFGIWMNVDSVRLQPVPSFYAVASSRPLDEILSVTENLRHRITIDQATRTFALRTEADKFGTFTDALVRIRERDALFQEAIGGVAVDQQTLFRTALDLPANLTEGDYITRIFLLRGGDVISEVSTVIDVRKVGLERFLFTLSRNQPLVYGLMSLAIAIGAGWLASAAFRVFQR